MKLQPIAALLLILGLLPVVLSANVDLDKLDVVKFSVTEGEEKTLQFNDVEYTLKADSLSESAVTLTFSPANYVTRVGKDKGSDVDIDSDGEIDFSLTLVSSFDRTASLEARRLSAKLEGEGEGDEGMETGGEALPDVTALSSALRQNLKWVGIVIAVLVIIILIAAFSKRKGSPEKFYRKAESLHMEAQEFHEDGDEETATELYTKAEEYREKARNLEKGEM